MQRSVVPPSPKAAARPPLPFRKWSASPLEARPKLFRGLAAASAITGGGAPVTSDGRAGGAARIVGLLFRAAALYGSGNAPPHSQGNAHVRHVSCRPRRQGRDRTPDRAGQIGRASCRERVCQYV